MVKDQDPTLRRLQRLSVKLREADAKADAIRGELRDAMLAARDAGATVSGIARALGVSRQRVQQLLK
jgi:hypothetical protein